MIFFQNHTNYEVPLLVNKCQFSHLFYLSVGEELINKELIVFTIIKCITKFYKTLI